MIKPSKSTRHLGFNVANHIFAVVIYSSFFSVTLTLASLTAINHVSFYPARAVWIYCCVALLVVNGNRMPHQFLNSFKIHSLELKDIKHKHNLFKYLRVVVVAVVDLWYVLHKFSLTLLKELKQKIKVPIEYLPV